MRKRRGVQVDIAPELTAILAGIGGAIHDDVIRNAQNLRQRLACYQLLMSRAAALLVDTSLHNPERGEVSRLLRGELDKMA